MKKTKGPWIWQDMLKWNVETSNTGFFFFLPQAAMNVDHEVKLLVEEIHRLGSKSKYYMIDTVFVLSFL